MIQQYALGVDLGGTKIACGLTDLDGNLLAKKTVPTLASEGVEAVIGRISETIRDVLLSANVCAEEVHGIGIGSPGPLNPKEGLIVLAPNLKWKNVPLAFFIENEFSLPTWLENDANAAALAEARFGAGRGADSILYITVSTGIGGGIIIGGDIYHGKNYMAGELGHTVVEPFSKVQCGCGQYGCLETISSGTAIARYARELIRSGRESIIPSLVGSLEEVNVPVVVQAASLGDSVANEVLERAFLYLGTFIISMLSVLDVERVVIGGGVSKTGEIMFQRLRSIVQERMASVPAKATPIVPAETGDDVGILGAAGIVLKNVQGRKTRPEAVVNQ